MATLRDESRVRLELVENDVAEQFQQMLQNGEMAGETADAPAPREPGLEPSARRRLLPPRRRTLKRQLTELRSELAHSERQLEQVRTEMQGLRGTLLQRKARLGELEEVLREEAARREVAEANLQECEDRLARANEELARLQTELSANEGRLLELEAARELAEERIERLEREGERLREQLVEVEGDEEQLRAQLAEAQPPSAEREPEGREAALAEGSSLADEGTGDRRADAVRAGKPRWRVERRERDESRLHVSFGSRLELFISGDSTADVMERLQSAAPQLQLLADALYPYEDEPADESP
jgi:DNA repair exonuclease SbcCD ATPase subunit